MAIDFNAVAQAVAARFSAANVTAPSGEQNIRLSTEALPANIVMEPTVLVFPPAVEWHYASSARTGIATFPVRFYIWRIRDNARNASLVLKWISALYAQMDGKVHLDLSSYVARATMSEITPGDLTWGDDKFDGFEMTVSVSLWEGLSAVA